MVTNNAEYMRKWNQTHPEKAREIWRTAFRKWYEKHKEEHYKSTLQWKQANKEKHAAHSQVHYHLLGLHPCLKTGCSNVAEAHHPDYSKPLEVVWLCKTHHKQLHKMESVSG